MVEFGSRAFVRHTWIVAVILACSITLAWSASDAGGAEQNTTVYIVRHAEKATGGGDVQLADPQGFNRAKALAHVLGDAGIVAIFVSTAIRTQQTGAPLAADLGITVQPCEVCSAQGIADKILTNHIGSRVLVVGHSNTVDDIAAALGAPGLSDLAEGQFDRLFVVHRHGTAVHIDQLRYGVRTP